MSSNLDTNRIVCHLAHLQASGRKAFIAYLSAGDPDLATTTRIVRAVAAAGTDVIELGIPFSDPMADGPAIQASYDRALRAGASVAGVLDLVRRVRDPTDPAGSCQVPLLLFTYLNPILAYGIDRFASDAVAAGADGVLLLDLPPEQDPGLLQRLRQAGLATVALAAPTTTPERCAFLARQSQGFLYYVCRLGVTGERTDLPADLPAKVAAIKAACPIPVCIGFGISSPEQAAAAAAAGDGCIVGSHLVRLIERQAGAPDLAAMVGARAAALAQAVHALPAR